MIPEILTEVLSIPGQSGYEYTIREYLNQKFEILGGTISKDGLGSIICKFEGTGEKKRKIMFSAHMDTCGFIVKCIKTDEIVSVVSFGYSDTKACHQQPVAIQTSKGLIKGLMIASKSDNKPKFEVDFGKGSSENTSSIKAGDPVHFINEPYLIGDSKNQVICSPRLDNRLGIFELILLAEELSKKPPKDDIYLVGTVEEEVGARGAKTASQKIKPDLAIVFDITYHELPVSMGKGPVLTLSDRAVIIPGPIRDFLCEIGKHNSVPIQTEVWNIGGTDASTIRTVGNGIPTIPILTATKNAHTPREIGCIKDCQQVIKYIMFLIKEVNVILDLFNKY